MAGALRVLFHVHTRYSADAWIKPEEILRHALAHNIGMVIVTDHDSHEGAAACARVSEGTAVTCPLAAEYRSDAGDMIATFLRTAVKTRDPLGIIQETHAQGGLVIIPHPFQRRPFPDRVLEGADLIEIFNSRCSAEQNARALDAAHQLGKPGIAGADAHFVNELGLAWNEFDCQPGADPQTILRSTPRIPHASQTTLRAIRNSQLLKAAREFRAIMAAKQLVRMLQAGPTKTP